MKKKVLLGLVASLVLSACEGELIGGGSIGKLQACGEGENLTGYHYQGQACGNCHIPRSPNYSIAGLFEIPRTFAAGGTIFSKIDEPDGNLGAYPYSVRLIEESTNRTFTACLARGRGNFALYSFPTRNFKVEVIDSNGNVVNKTLGYTHSPNRFDCNSCHRAIAGSTTSPGRIVNYDLYAQNQNPLNPKNPPANVSQNLTVAWSTVIFPQLVNDCGGCHQPNSLASSLNSSFVIYTNNSDRTYNLVLNGTPNTPGYTSFINKVQPINSLIILKALNDPNLKWANGGGVGHGGGQIYTNSKVENPTLYQKYQNLVVWIQNGAPKGTTPTVSGNLSYTRDIQPILKNKCSACHFAGSGRIFTVDMTVSQLISNGLVVKGSPSQSPLYRKGSGIAPHTGGNALGVDSQKVYNWILQGANP